MNETVRPLTPELLQALEGIIHFSDALAYRQDDLSIALRHWIERAQELLDGDPLTTQEKPS